MAKNATNLNPLYFSFPCKNLSQLNMLNNVCEFHTFYGRTTIIYQFQFRTNEKKKNNYYHMNVDTIHMCKKKKHEP